MRRDFFLHEAKKQDALADSELSLVSDLGNDFINGRATCKALWDQSPSVASDDLDSLSRGLGYRAVAINFRKASLQAMGQDQAALDTSYDAMGALRKKAADCAIHRS
jgi:hypothetical protein